MTSATPLPQALRKRRTADSTLLYQARARASASLFLSQELTAISASAMSICAGKSRFDRSDEEMETNFNKREGIK